MSLMARYLDIPLRYQMEVMGSRSSIRDETGSAKYPLYIKGADQERFDIGVFFMNKNVEQILDAIGVHPEDLRKTLCNLHKVYEQATKALNPAQ